MVQSLGAHRRVRRAFGCAFQFLNHRQARSIVLERILHQIPESPLFVPSGGLCLWIQAGLYRASRASGRNGRGWRTGRRKPKQFRVDARAGDALAKLLGARAD